MSIFEEDEEIEIVGSGGYGLIIANKGVSDLSNGNGNGKPKTVKKLLYGNWCGDAEIEFNKHADVYRSFLNNNNELYNQITMPKPIDFTRLPMRKFNKRFECSYNMTRLNTVFNGLPLTGFTTSSLYHITNDETVGVNKELGRVYSEAISSSNPSRGFFANYTYIENILLPSLNPQFKGKITNIQSIVRHIGFIFSLITFSASYVPKDVEYTLGASIDKSSLVVAFLDFGMIFKIDYSPIFNNIEETEKKMEQIAVDLIDAFNFDIYFPVTDDLIKEFIHGVVDAINLVPETDPFFRSKYRVFQLFINELRR